MKNKSNLKVSIPRQLFLGATWPDSVCMWEAYLATLLLDFSIRVYTRPLLVFLPTRGAKCTSRARASEFLLFSVGPHERSFASGLQGIYSRESKGTKTEKGPSDECPPGVETLASSRVIYAYTYIRLAANCETAFVIPLYSRIRPNKLLHLTGESTLH